MQCFWDFASHGTANAVNSHFNQPIYIANSFFGHLYQIARLTLLNLTARR